MTPRPAPPQVNNLEVVYNHVVLVLKGLSLAVPGGRIVALLGSNGAGKTTTLKAICGLLPLEDGAIDGGVALRGERLDGPGSRTRSRAPASSRCWRGARSSRTSPWRRTCAAGPTPAATASRVRRRPGQVLRATSPGSRSAPAAGRLPVRRRAADAGHQPGALARPKLMLLDEPSLGLAPLLVEEIFEIIAAINREEGTTILLVEQNAQMALAVRNYGYIMENGRVVLDGPVERLRQDQDVQEFYLGLARRGEELSRREALQAEKRGSRERTRCPKLLRERAAGAPRRGGAAGEGVRHLAARHLGDYLGHVRRFGLGLGRLGLARGDNVAILSENCREWLYAELAAMARRRWAWGSTRPAPAPEVHYVVEHSEASFVVCEDQEQADKILEVSAELPARGKIIVADMRGARHYPDRASSPSRRWSGWAPSRSAPSPGLSRSWWRHRRPTTWRSSSTPRAPPAPPRAP